MDSIFPDTDFALSPSQVAHILGLNKITLIRMRQRPDQGGLPFVQLSPGRIGYMRSDVQAYIAMRRVGSLPSRSAAETGQQEAA